MYENFYGWDTPRGRDYIDKLSSGLTINTGQSPSASALTVSIASTPSFRIRQGASTAESVVIEGMNGIVPLYNSLAFVGSFTRHHTTFNTATYALAATEDILGFTGNVASQVTLGPASTAGRIVTVVDESNSAAINSITISSTSGFVTGIALK